MNRRKEEKQDKIFWQARQPGSNAGTARFVRIAALSTLFITMILINLATALAYYQSHNLSEIRIVDSDLIMEVYKLNASQVNTSLLKIDGYNLDSSSGSLQWRTYTIWHSNNDGSGSTLDADTIDGNNYLSTWPTTLGNIQTATSSDFHNIGGTDEDNQTFAEIGAGTVTSKTFTVGSGASIVPSGTGSITATGTNCSAESVMMGDGACDIKSSFGDGTGTDDQTFAEIGTGTATSVTFVVGTSAVLYPSGSGVINASNTSDVTCTNCVALGSETTGNYAASSSEGGPATDVSCSNCVTLGSETSGSYDSDASNDLTTSTSWTGDLGGTGSSPTVDDDSHLHDWNNVSNTPANLDTDSTNDLTTSTNFGGDVSGTYGAIVVADDSHNHDAANITAGTLATARGGTALSTFSASGRLLYSTSASALTTLAIGGSGTYLRSDSATPSWSSIQASDLPAGFDTNASTACASGEYLDGSGSCINEYDATDDAVGSIAEFQSGCTDCVGNTDIAANSVDLTSDALSSAYAGSGLTGGGASALAVGTGTCITVNANDVAVTSNCVDATTVDSINGASLLRSDADDTFTGNVTGGLNAALQLGDGFICVDNTGGASPSCAGTTQGTVYADDFVCNTAGCIGTNEVDESSLDHDSLTGAGTVDTITEWQASCTDCVDGTGLADTVTLDAELAITQGGYNVNFDSNTLVVNGSANSVGIGTTGPATKLHVQGGSIIGNSSGSTSFVSGTGVFGSGSVGVNGTGTSRGVYGQYDANHYAYLGSFSHGVYAYSIGTYGVQGNGGTYGVYGSTNAGGYGVYGYFDATHLGYVGSGGNGVYGLGDTGVRGEYNSDTTIFGELGTAMEGVHGDGGAGAYGVKGESDSSYGVYGVSTSSTGVHGTGATGVNGTGTVNGVYGQGSTYGVYGFQDGTTNYGYIAGAGTGVYGEGSTYGVFGNSSSYGVYGESSSGYAGYFDGKGYFSGNTSIGDAGWSGNNIFSVFKSDTYKGAGTSAIFGRRAGTSGGSDWGEPYVDAAVKGYAFDGRTYSAGVAAYSYLDDANSAALVAGDRDGSPLVFLGYHDANAYRWAGYFNGSVALGVSSGDNENNIIRVPTPDTGPVGFSCDANTEGALMWNQSNTYKIWACQSGSWRQEYTPRLWDSEGREIRIFAAGLRETDTVSKTYLDGYNVSSDLIFYISNVDPEIEFFDQVYINLRCYSDNLAMDITKRYNLVSSNPYFERLSQDDDRHIALKQGEKVLLEFEKPALADAEGCTSTEFEFVASGYYEMRVFHDLDEVGEKPVQQENLPKKELAES